MLLSALVAPHVRTPVRPADFMLRPAPYAAEMTPKETEAHFDMIFGTGDKVHGEPEDPPL